MEVRKSWRNPPGKAIPEILSLPRGLRPGIVAPAFMNPFRVLSLIAGRRAVLASGVLFLTAGLGFAQDAASAERKVAQAAEAQNRGWLVSSRKLLEEAVALDPNAPGLKFQRAIQELREGHPRRAAAFARASLASRQKVADCHTLLGLLALRDKNLPEAERQMRMALAAEPENARDYYNLSEVLRWRGRPADALAQLEIAREKQPGDPVTQLKIRLAQIEVGDRLTFIRPKAAEGNAPEDPSWTLTEAALALKGGKIDKAVLLLEQARNALPAEFFHPLLAEDHFFQTYKSEPALARYFDKATR